MGHATPQGGTPRPDFFLVGAFKSGTTAMYEFLRQHPQVYMPFHKEPLFFGDDLSRRYGRLTLDEYLALFRDARPGQRIGEASAWHLYSSSAAREIKEFAPNAQIVVILRNPVDVMHAQHSQLLFNRQEDIIDFAEALAAEPARRRGERLPPGPIRVENLYYRHSVRFAEQLERYFKTFGRDRVHVIVYDDFMSNVATSYEVVLAFLGVETSFRPSFEVHNPNKSARSRLVQRLIYDPPIGSVRAIRLLRRFPGAHRARAFVLSLNSRRGARPPMDETLRRELLEEFRPEIERLGRLIERDLTGLWRADRVRR